LDPRLLAFLEHHGAGFTLAEAIEARRDEVKRRIETLNGGKRVRRVAIEAERRETHWDFLLKEMLWMSEDFGQEKKRHQGRAKKLVKAVETYFRQAEARKARAQKDELARLRRRAAQLGRSVKLFWSKINKVVGYKQKIMLDEQKKSSMDKHLNFIVEQTERYTFQLVHDFNTSTDAEDTDGGYASQRSPKPGSLAAGIELESTADDDEDEAEAEEQDDVDDPYENEEEYDDETTIAQAEREQLGGHLYNADDEVDDLQKDSQRSMEDLLREYHAMQAAEAQERAERTASMLTSSDEGDAGSEEYAASEEESDDEETIAQAEKEMAKNSVQDELAALEREGEVPLEDLIEMHRLATEADDGSASGVASNVLHVEGRNALLTNGSATSSSNVDADDDAEEDDYTADSEELDDETTIAQAEAGASARDNEAEVQDLQVDADVPIEKLLELYQQMNAEFQDDGKASRNGVDSEMETGSISDSNSSSENSAAGEDEYLANADDVDDETTIARAEAEASAHDKEAELQDLQDGADVPIEKLWEQYRQMDQELNGDEMDTGDDAVRNNGKEHGLLAGDVDESMSVVDSEDGRTADVTNPTEDARADDRRNGQDHAALLARDRRNDAGADSHGDTSDTVVKRMARLDQEVKSRRVERPYILVKSLQLREYQEIGVSWLASLHERRLNGILADEMGLGKTVQTISLLAWVACFRGVWGPHLIVVPTSVIVNWESELKRFCPAFKVLTYYGSATQRKALRTGWSKLNAFHVCITSYQLILKDASSFRRKKWYYLILDEAHNIKNFQSQRWNTLISFNTQRRLLLTGTPLQNSLMELWALMHFLMPHIFTNRAEFSYWFSNPLNNMIENNSSINRGLIRRLHSIMRPFLLRRLKKDVAKQLPKKFEHLVYCDLSRRQQFLYEDFLSRSSTRAALTGGNFMGMMNVLMQLRKVCNHPDLFEARPIRAPFVMQPVCLKYPQMMLRLRCPGMFTFVSSTAAWHPQLSEAERRLRLPIDLAPMGTHRTALDEKNSGAIAQFVEVQDVALPRAASAQLRQAGTIRDAFEALLAKRRSESLRRRREMYYINESRREISFHDRMKRSASFLEGVYLSLSEKAGEARRSPQSYVDVPSLLIKAVQQPSERLGLLESLLKSFAFVTPKVTARTAQLVGVPSVDERVREEFPNLSLRKQIADRSAPFYEVSKRLQMYFPDRKLVQFDCGKLQSLAELLRRLHNEGHKCLIFTQMSKMLDVLEEFLNIYNYNYLRLDGSTGVEKRQKLMDRFNSDEKVFCFILSTRSGGLGINLTGADTVIFYDSDWNPAMDAQAQDRAHRIGQTREVHIYRLVSKSTIEENILVKARQKQQLDFLVMTEGNFGAKFYTGENLKGLLNTGTYASNAEKRAAETDKAEDAMAASPKLDEGAGANPDVKAVMAQLEDAEDASALVKTTKEIEEETREFDDAAAPEDDPSGDTPAAGRAEEQKGRLSPTLSPTASESNWKAEDEAAEKSAEARQNEEFASWRQEVGTNLARIDESLSAVERYAVKIKSTVDCFYSVHYRTDAQRLQDVTENSERWDIHEWEQAKAQEEHAALSSGELIYTGVTKKEARMLRRRYTAEKQRRVQARKLRRLKGDDWVVRTDGKTQLPFWMNLDTGEATWFKPKVVQDRTEMQEAMDQRFNAVPPALLLRIMEYCSPHPDRAAAALVCYRWFTAARSEKLCLRVLPIEAQNPAEDPAQQGGARARPTGRATPVRSLGDAIRVAKTGDTIILDGGHYWEENLSIVKSVRIVGSQVSKTVLELTGFLFVGAWGVTFSNVSIRKTKREPDGRNLIVVSTAPAASLDGGRKPGRSSCRLHDCFIDADGAGGGAAIYLHNHAQLEMTCSTIVNAKASGIFVGARCTAYVYRSRIRSCEGSGITNSGGSVGVLDSYVHRNGAAGISVFGRAVAHVERCELTENGERQSAKRGGGPMAPFPRGAQPAKKRLRIYAPISEGAAQAAQTMQSSGDMNARHEASASLAKSADRLSSVVALPMHSGPASPSDCAISCDDGSVAAQRENDIL